MIPSSGIDKSKHSSVYIISSCLSSAELVSGDVTIKEYDGELHLKTVSGDLDVTMKKAEVSAKTLTGSIYSNLDIDIQNKGRKNYGHNKIIGTVNNGGKLVRMETVSGDIYLRKS